MSLYIKMLIEMSIFMARKFSFQICQNKVNYVHFLAYLQLNRNIVSFI